MMKELLHTVILIDVAYNPFSTSVLTSVRTSMKKRRIVKPSCISTVPLKASQPLHAPPIKLVVFQRTYQAYPVRELILVSASHLDAFSGYPSRT